MVRLMIVCTLMLTTACIADKTVGGYGAADRVWTLTEVDGLPYPARATLSFPEYGQIAGQAPCNRYTGTMSAPYPWFQTGPIAATRMACPDLAAETTFFEVLAQMNLSEVLDDTLILTNGTGREMVFKASE
jgi:heat shock protein HslJ